MTPVQFPDLLPALPEIVLAVGSMALLMLGVFNGDRSARLVAWLSVLLLLLAGVLVAAGGGAERVTFFGAFVSDAFSSFAKMLILLGSITAILLGADQNERDGQARFEYPILIVLSTLGMLMMVSAADLISLYLGLELQSLALYVLAAFRRETVRSTEAGLKYFVLGALSSGMLLYGSSLLYGFAGTTSFEALATTLRAGEPAIGVIFGIVFLAAGLAFKVSAVPFHMWTPDVYEGAPTPVTAFFAVAPKIAAVALLLRVMLEPLGGLVDQWRQIIIFISVGSMVLGAFAAINQTNIKRLMAYSSIGHVGYALVGLAAGTAAGVRGVLIYMAIYLFMTAGTFAVILCMRQKDRMVEGIQDLAGLSRTRPLLALALAIFMFSMAGIPPLAGFFGKLYVFMAAIDAARTFPALYALAIIGVLASVVGAYYYLRIVKIMYFDEPAEGFDRNVSGEVHAIIGVAAVFTLLFFIYPAPLLSAAATAAAALVKG
ncbi:NADH dehydrogenase subunit N [Stella humosa]|uniref:NADH-quinone oxidoreductase subunit N n=1 Tax=Stella humosa TaxID=94 RepID=A0A3N1MDQ1_9PROT|nr:NADH-quinone oxidoreductase subunit NuoN [Stella humosa]ROQ01678.1 NADH dehydrogenase subunit N [Stella humosa]BBK32060.1 NADH-quinone oxidoreductase subunit N [Stella humosa]